MAMNMIDSEVNMKRMLGKVLFEISKKMIDNSSICLDPNVNIECIAEIDWCISNTYFVSVHIVRGISYTMNLNCILHQQYTLTTPNPT